MDDLDAALAEVTRGLADLTRQVGPEAAEATLRAVRLDGVFHILGSAFGLFFGVALLIVSVWAFRQVVKSEIGWKEPTATNLTALISGFIGLMFTIIKAANAFVADKWISAIDPAAGLAYRLLEKL